MTVAAFLALLRRARRHSQPHIRIELDVFVPGTDKRAVRIFVPACQTAA